MARGPTAEARELARQVKQARVAQQRTLVANAIEALATDIQLGQLPKNELIHRKVYEAAGVSRATYFRYLRTDPDLRQAVLALTDPPTPAPPAQAQEDSSDELLRLRAELKSHRTSDLNLRRQIAACRAWIANLNLALTAARKDVKSKDALLAGSRSRENTLVEIINNLCEQLIGCGVEPDFTLLPAEFVPPAPESGLKVSDFRARASRARHLKLVDVPPQCERADAEEAP